MEHESDSKSKCLPTALVLLLVVLLVVAAGIADGDTRSTFACPATCDNVARCIIHRKIG